MDNLKEGARLLNIYTGGHPGRFAWVLTGNVKRSCRNHVLSGLLGEKVKCGQEGITRLRDEFFRAFNIPKNCIAQMEDDLIVKVKELLNP